MANSSAFLVADGIALFQASDLTNDAMAIFEDGAREVLAAAQANAPWADRTGMARAGLETQVYESNGEIVLELYHTVDYGLWLEVIQGGAYATIMPTLEEYAPRLFEAAGGKVTSTEEGDML